MSLTRVRLGKTFNPNEPCTGGQREENGIKKRDVVFTVHPEDNPVLSLL